MVQVFMTQLAIWMSCADYLASQNVEDPPSTISYPKFSTNFSKCAAIKNFGWEKGVWKCALVWLDYAESCI